MDDLDSGARIEAYVQCIRQNMEQTMHIIAEAHERLSSRSADPQPLVSRAAGLSPGSCSAAWERGVPEWEPASTIASSPISERVTHDGGPAERVMGDLTNVDRNALPRHLFPTLLDCDPGPSPFKDCVAEVDAPLAPPEVREDERSATAILVLHRGTGHEALHPPLSLQGVPQVVGKNSSTFAVWKVVLGLLGLLVAAWLGHVLTRTRSTPVVIHSGVIPALPASMAPPTSLLRVKPSGDFLLALKTAAVTRLSAPDAQRATAASRDLQPLPAAADGLARLLLGDARAMCLGPSDTESMRDKVTVQCPMMPGGDVEGAALPLGPGPDRQGGLEVEQEGRGEAGTLAVAETETRGSVGAEPPVPSSEVAARVVQGADPGGEPAATLLVVGDGTCAVSGHGDSGPVASVSPAPAAALDLPGPATAKPSSRPFPWLAVTAVTLASALPLSAWAAYEVGGCRAVHAMHARPRAVA